MIRYENKRHNPKTTGGDHSLEPMATPVIQPFSHEPVQLSTHPKLAKLQRKHSLTEKGKALAAAQLAARVGSLTLTQFSHARITDRLPRRVFQAGQLIPCNDALYWIKSGSVLIRHSRHKYPVKWMRTGGVFGEMPLLGQTMLVTEAVAGPSNVTVAAMSFAAAREWIKSDPVGIVLMMGPKLMAAERDYFRSQFQTHDSNVAALLLRHAGAGLSIEGLTQETLADEIGIYRETMNTVLRELESLGLIKSHNRKITILDKTTLTELSEL